MHVPLPRPARGFALLVATGLVAASATALAGAGSATAATGPDSAVKVNQTAYVPTAAKKATLVSTSTTPAPWSLRTSSGSQVASGTTTVLGADAPSGDRVHIIDFSAYTTPGTGYTLAVGGEVSSPFDISTEPYRKLRYDSLAFFYHQRSGTPIEAAYVGSTYARPTAHVNVSPNQGDNNVTCRSSSVCSYALDGRGGWYDAGDHGKYVVNGGISAWQLLDIHERTVHVAGADRSALADGTMAIPERGNGVPDILDEARWEVDWLLRMQAPDGSPNAGMVHHKLSDDAWTGIPMRPHQDPQPRHLSVVTTSATLNMAAVAAKAARIWRTIDPTFSTRALTAAEKAYAAAKARPNAMTSSADDNGSGSYGDNTLTDEFYWAAAELYVTTAKDTYRADVTSSGLYRGRSLNTRGFDWGSVGALGDVSLAFVPNGLPTADLAATRSAITTTADGLISVIDRQGYPAAYAPSGGRYEWGSNGLVANNANVLAMAYDLTGDAKYRDAVFAVYDYLLGRNPLSYSYVTGYGERPVRNVHHRFWANQNDGSLPIAPPGVLSGGPNSSLQDPVMQARLQGCVAQKCFVDDIGAYAANEVTVNWNSAFAWMANWAAEKAAAGPGPTTTTTRPTTTTTTRSSTTTTRPTTTTRSSTTTTRPTTTTTTTRSSTTSSSTSVPTGPCTASYRVINQWQGGFQGEVTVAAGSAPINGWTVSWTPAAGVSVTQSWSSRLVSTSPLTFRNESWNGSLGAGTSTTFGFIGTWTGTNAVPQGITCTSP